MFAMVKTMVASVMAAMTLCAGAPGAIAEEVPAQEADKPWGMAVGVYAYNRETAANEEDGDGLMLFTLSGKNDDLEHVNVDFQNNIIGMEALAQAEHPWGLAVGLFAYDSDKDTMVPVEGETADFPIEDALAFMTITDDGDDLQIDLHHWENVTEKVCTFLDENADEIIDAAVEAAPVLAEQAVNAFMNWVNAPEVSE